MQTFVIGVIVGAVLCWLLLAIIGAGRDDE